MYHITLHHFNSGAQHLLSSWRDDVRSDTTTAGGAGAGTEAGAANSTAQQQPGMPHRAPDDGLHYGPRETLGYVHVYKYICVRVCVIDVCMSTNICVMCIVKKCFLCYTKGSTCAKPFFLCFRSYCYSSVALLCALTALFAF